MNTLQSLRLFVTNKWKLLLEKNIQKFSSEYPKLNTIDVYDCAKQIENVLYSSCNKKTKMEIHNYMYCQIYIYVYLTDLFTKQHNETFLLHIYNSYIKNNIRDIVHCNEYIIKHILKYKCENDTEIKKFIHKIVDNVKNISEYMFIDFKKNTPSRTEISTRQIEKSIPLKQMELEQRNKQMELEQRNKQMELEQRNKQMELEQKNKQMELEKRQKQIELEKRQKQMELEQRNKQMELEKMNLNFETKKKELSGIENVLESFKKQQIELNAKTKEQLEKQELLRQKLEQKLKETNTIDNETEQKLRKQLETNIEQQFKSIEQQKSELQKKIKETEMEKQKLQLNLNDEKKLLNEQLENFKRVSEQNTQAVSFLQNQLKDFMKQSLDTLQQKSQVNNNDKNVYNKNIEETNKKLNDLLRQINLPKNIECCEELKTRLEQIQREQKNLVNSNDMRMFKKSWEDLFARVIVISNIVSKMASKITFNTNSENTLLTSSMLEHQKNMQNLIEKMMSNMNNKLDKFSSVINRLENNINMLDNKNIQTQIQPLFENIKNANVNISKIEQLFNSRFLDIERKIEIINNNTNINNTDIKTLLGFFNKFEQYLQYFTQNIEQILSKFRENVNYIGYKPENLNELTEVLKNTENAVNLQLEKIENISKPLLDFSKTIDLYKNDMNNINKELKQLSTKYQTDEVPIKDIYNLLKIYYTKIDNIPNNIYKYFKDKYYENINQKTLKGNEYDTQKLALPILEKSDLQIEKQPEIKAVETLLQSGLSNSYIEELKKINYLKGICDSTDKKYEIIKKELCNGDNKKIRTMLNTIKNKYPEAKDLAEFQKSIENYINEITSKTQTQQPQQTEQTEQTQQIEQPQQTEQTEQTQQIEQTEQTQQIEQPQQTEQTQQNEEISPENLPLPPSPPLLINNNVYNLSNKGKEIVKNNNQLFSSLSL
jgi:hypothetical protein